MNSILINVHTNLGVTKMCPRFIGTDSWIVFVDSVEFCKYWALRSKQVNDVEQYRLASGGLKEWCSDYKYQSADKAMRDMKLIIPVSHVGFYIHRSVTEITKKRFFFLRQVVGYNEVKVARASFVDGITRFIWLMSHGATSIPVECDSEEIARLLYEYAGDKNLPVISIDQAMESYSTSGKTVVIDSSLNSA